MAYQAHSLSHPVTKGTKGVQLNVYALESDTSIVRGDKAAVVSDAETALTGTSTSSGTAVSGTSAAYTTELSVGDTIFNSSTGEYRVVVSIADDDNLVVDSAYTTPLTGTLNKFDTTYHSDEVAELRPFQGHLYFEESQRSDIDIEDEAKVVSLVV